jgi:hypothetical protein
MIDIAQFFNDTIPAALASNADKAKLMQGTFQIIIKGAGAWHLDPTSNPPSCTAGTKPADATLTISADDFQKLYADPKGTAMGLIMRGKLKVDGKYGVAMAAANKLRDLFGGN